MQYIKNVTNKNEIGKTAYMDCEGVFHLGFNDVPTKPKIGDTIVLYQSIEGISYFSHLVVIIDSDVHTDNTPNYEHYLYVYIIAKGWFDMSKTSWNQVHHGGYSSGKLVNIDHIGQVKTNNVSSDTLCKEVWNLFFPVPKKTP